jgi:hypothetical protein
MGPALENPPGVWTRQFKNDKGITKARWNENTKTGSVHWAGDPPPPPPPPPLPGQCGQELVDTAMAYADLGGSEVVNNTGEHGRCASLLLVGRVAGPSARALTWAYLLLPI